MQSTFRVGHLIRGQYKVIDLLGQGASSAVYLVADERDHQKQFALKEVMQAVRVEQRSLPYDAVALRRLNHPALPRMYRVFAGNNNDRFYILMDYVEGYNLEAMRQLMPRKRFSLHAAMTLMSPIIDAVSYLHRQHHPLIHGDIKPSNIIPPNPGTLDTPKLVDFGSGKNLNTDAAAQQLTHNFRAPEQYGGRASRRTDVYALGAIFYTLLTGALPASASDRLARIGAGEPDPLLPMNHFMPSSPIVDGAIQSALSIDRKDRFTTAEQFLEALWQVIHANQVTGPIPELTMVVPSREHTGPLVPEQIITPPIEKENREPDAASDAMLQAMKMTTSAANVAIQAEGNSLAVFSGSPLSPAIAGEGKPRVKAASQEGLPVIRRKKRRLPANGRGNGKYKRRKRNTWRSNLIFIALLLIFVIGSGIAVDVSQTIYNAQYQKELALAQVGLKHLAGALTLMQAWSKKPFSATSVTPEQHEFAAAAADFAKLDTDLRAFSGIATLFPGNAANLRTALRIVPIAMKIAQAGVVGCAALNVMISRLQEPFGAGGGLSLVDVTTIGVDFHQVEADIKQAIAQVNSLQPEDLQFDARVSKVIDAFHQYLPSVQAILRETDQLLPALPALLGISVPAYYLVEILDSTELRPGGGFIKDYGYAGFIGGRLSTAYITDVHLLDTHFRNTGQTLSLPGAYRWFNLASNSWNLRDSNLDADFPTAAHYAEQNYYLEGGKVPLQGVIAITSALMADALSITGPIGLPELHETVTAQNLINRIHHYEPWLGHQGGSGSILLPNGHSAGSRYFTQLLAKHFLERFHQVRSAALPALFQMLVSSLRTKDLQIYFDAPPAENLLHFSHLDGAIPASMGDSFFVVDANIAANNANQFITDTLDDSVTIDGNGNAIHHTAIRYAWLKNGFVFGPPLYSDYVRIFVPPGSLLQAQQAWQPRGTSKSFGREVWAGSFTLSYGQTRTVTLTWTEKGVAKKDAAGWHYQYLVQRQASTQWKLNIQITLPSCVVRTHTSGGLISHNNQATTLNQTLIEDTNLGIDYSC